MNDLTTRPRPVTIEVSKEWSQHHKRRHHAYNERANVNDDSLQIPLELRPVIKAMLVYGKQTHSLGAARAISALTNVEEKLRSYVNERKIVDLNETINEISDVVSKLRLSLAQNYNDE